MRVTAAVLLALGILVLSFSAASASSHGKVVFIIADGLTLADITSSEFSNLHQLCSKGSIGLLCTGNAKHSPGSVYATASAGSSCVADDSAAESFSVYESVDGELDNAGIVFARRLGIPADAGVVSLSMDQIVRYNQQHSTVSQPGALGDAIKAAGRKSAVFGNSDALNNRYRFSVMLAADSSGVVPVGDVGYKVLKKSTRSPAGFVTDADKLTRMVKSALKHADFVVVDFGDLARVERMRSRCSDSAYQVHRREALKSLNEFVGMIVQEDAGDSTVFLTSFIHHIPKQGEPERLSPIVIYRGGSSQGVVFSSTTRTLGLVSVIDIAPTVLAELGIRKPSNMMGCPINSMPGGLDTVYRIDDTAAVNDVLLRPVLGIIAAIGITAITLLCIALVMRRRVWWAYIAQFGIVSMLCSPVGMMFAGVGDMHIYSYIIRLTSWTFGLVIFAYVMVLLIRRRIKSKSNNAHLFVSPIISAAVLVCVVLFIDSFLGGRLARFTLLNAGDFSGFRFYGIGNEYMGLWLGMFIVAVLWIREMLLCVGICSKAINSAIGIIGAAAAVALGHPVFGANAGGAIAAISGFWLIYVSGVLNRIRARDVVYAVVAGIVFVVLLGVVDMYTAGNSKSHIGLAASAAKQSGVGYLASLAIRKIGMNFSLLGTKQAMAALWGAVPFALLWFTGVGEAVGSAIRPYKSLRNGLIAGLICAGVAMLFNDSGVVSAGIMFACLVAAVVDFALFGAGSQDANSCA